MVKAHHQNSENFTFESKCLFSVILTSMTHRGRTRRQPFAKFLALSILCAGWFAAPTHGAQHGVGEVDELMRRGIEALDRGQEKKAEEWFRKADEAAGGNHPDPLIGLARVHVAREEWRKALADGGRALHVATTETHRLLAQAELAVAAAHARAATELEAALQELREFLRAGVQGGGLESQLRIKLCQARGGLPDEHSNSLTHIAPGPPIGV